MIKPLSRPSLRRATLGAVSALALCPLGAMAQETPLEGYATRLANFETANMMPGGTWTFQGGTHQTIGSGAGTGSQLYYGAIDYAFTDDLQFGFSTQVIEDVLEEPILGIQPGTRFLSYGANLKYRFVNTRRVQIAAQASVEMLGFRTALFGTHISGANNVIGSVQMPITYRAAPGLQLHLTPGVSVFPETLNGIPYYGTVASLGAGATWKPNDRFQAFAHVTAPLTGGNTIDTTRTIIKKLVYTAGARYAFTPKVALEGYVTNGVGVTPATSVLTFYPDGDEPMFGLRVLYTPGKKLRNTYRPLPLSMATARDIQLQQDGFTVGSASVLEPGALRLGVSGGDQGNYALVAAYGLDRDFQLDAIVEDYSNDGSLTLVDDPTPNSARWMAGGRIRLLDQNNGAPVSMSARVLGGRDTVNLDVGVIYVSTPISYDFSDRATIHVEPKFAAFGNTTIAGLGLGANFEMFDGLQLMAEVTPVSDGRDVVWSAGARYDMPGNGFSVDVSATNAIGRYGHGTMVAQDEPRYSIGLSKQFNIRGWR